MIYFVITKLQLFYNVIDQWFQIFFFRGALEMLKKNSPSPKNLNYQFYNS